MIRNFQQQAKIGLAVSIEAPTEEVAEQQEKLAASNATAMSPPF